jgi:two-component system LytT family response regulator
MIKTVIIDDEPLARARIRRLIGHYEEFQLVGEGGNGAEGIELIKLNTPDLIFLDIEMPDMNGFDMLSKHETEKRPFIVFCTAYSQYALKAFDADAIDYLLKPYDADRFDRTIQKVLTYLHVVSQHKTEQHEEEYLKEVVIVEKGLQTIIPLHEVDYMEAYGNYIKLYHRNGRHIYRSSMNEFLKVLDPALFKRVHRSLILNTGAISNIMYKGKNVYLIEVAEKELISGRKYAQAIKDLSGTIQ